MKEIGQRREESRIPSAPEWFSHVTRIRVFVQRGGSLSRGEGLCPERVVRILPECILLNWSAHCEFKLVQEAYTLQVNEEDHTIIYAPTRYPGSVADSCLFKESL